MDPPPCVQNAMLTKDKKPFTYTPGGINLSEIKSPRLGRRIERNAHYGEDEPASSGPQVQTAPVAYQNIPPQALAAMQPQMHVQVLPPGQVPLLPKYNAPPPPPPPSGGIPPPPPPMQPLPTQKVITGDNLIVERPDMTKIIPDNPMALLRKTSGPKPRPANGLGGVLGGMENQNGGGYQQQQPGYQPQQPGYQNQQPGYQNQQPIYQQQPAVQKAPSVRVDSGYQPPKEVERVQQRQPEPPRVKQFEPPVKVIERSPPKQELEPPIKTSTAHLGSLYIPPINNAPQQQVHNGNNNQQQQQQPRQSPSVRSPVSPEWQPPQDPSPVTPTLNKAPRPWQNQRNQQEVPAWAKRDQPGTPGTPSTPGTPGEQQQAPQQQQQQKPQQNQRWPQQPPRAQQTPDRVLRVNIITEDEHGRPCSPRALIHDPVTGQQHSIPVNLDGNGQVQVQGELAKFLKEIGVSSSAPPQPIYTDTPAPTSVNNQQRNNPNAVYVSQPTVVKHPGGIRQQQGGERVVPLDVEGAGRRQSGGGTPGTPGGDPRLNRQQSWTPIQSNSFKMLQKLTNTDGDLEETGPVTEHGPRYNQEFQQQQPSEQIRRMKINDEGDRNLLNKFKQGVDEERPLHTEPDPRYRGAVIPSKAFKYLQSMTERFSPPKDNTSVPDRSPTPAANKAPQVRTIPIQIEGEPQTKYVPPSEQTVPEPKKYMGSSIPSKSFKMLQAMTSPESCAYASEVIENANDPSYSYPYPYYDPSYPPPPYWYDPYYNYCYPPPPRDSELPQNDKEDKEMEAINKNKEKNDNSQRQTPARQTPQPYMNYYSPYPYNMRPLYTPTTDGESESESSRKTPQPYWGYNHYYHPSYMPQFMEQPQNEESGNETPGDSSMYPGYTYPYWDPYYYQYYYGYPPPVYSPYPYYHVNNSDTEELGGYSSTDEMSLYSKKFLQEKNKSLRPQSRNSMTPTPVRKIDTPTPKMKEKTAAKANEIHNKKISSSGSNKSIHQEIKEKLKSISPQLKDEVTESETEIYPSDTESDSDTEKEDQEKCLNRDGSFNALQSLKSVTDVTLYTEEEEVVSDDDTSVCSEDLDDSSTFAIVDDTMPHQLSVIYEESEKTDTSKIERQTRASSVLSDTSTIADRAEDIEDEECTIVNIKLPAKKKNKQNGIMTEIQEEMVKDELQDDENQTCDSYLSSEVLCERLRMLVDSTKSIKDGVINNSNNNNKQSALEEKQEQTISSKEVGEEINQNGTIEDESSCIDQDSSHDDAQAREEIDSSTAGASVNDNEINDSNDKDEEKQVKSPSPDFWSMIQKDEDDIICPNRRRSYYIDYDYEDYFEEENRNCDKEILEDSSKSKTIDQTTEESSPDDRDDNINSKFSEDNINTIECQIEETETLECRVEETLQTQETRKIVLSNDGTISDSTSYSNDSSSKSHIEYILGNSVNFEKIADDSSDDSSSSDEEDEDDNQNEAQEDATEEMDEESSKPLSIKERIKALQDLIKKKQEKLESSRLINKEKMPEGEKPEKDKLQLPETNETQNSKTVSTKSSLKSFEELSEEEVDSGVTSDMSRHISDCEEFPELGKMSKYQRAATHSRLFKLLQEECDAEDDDEIETPNGTKQEDRRSMLSLPLKNVNQPLELDDDFSNCSINEKLVNELIQSMLKQRKGKVFRSMSMIKLRAAAVKILQEEASCTSETPEDISSFLSPGRPSTENSSAAQTPQEFYNTSYNDYKNYYESWSRLDAIDSNPKALKLIQEHESFNSNKSGGFTVVVAKCPRIVSKKIGRDLGKTVKSSEVSPPKNLSDSPGNPDSVLDRNQVTSAS